MQADPSDDVVAFFEAAVSALVVVTFFAGFVLGGLLTLRAKTTSFRRKLSLLLGASLAITVLAMGIVESLDVPKNHAPDHAAFELMLWSAILGSIYFMACDWVLRSQTPHDSRLTATSYALLLLASSFCIGAGGIAAYAAVSPVRFH